MALGGNQRVQGQNVHLTFTADNADGTINTAFGRMTGYVDRLEVRAVPSYNTYTPVGMPKDIDQPNNEHWEATLTNGDKPAIMMYISQFMSAQRQAKNPMPTLNMRAVGYSPDDNSVAFNFHWTDGTLMGATLTVDGKNNHVSTSGDLKFQSMPLDGAVAVSTGGGGRR